jgi:hypothetical protein
VSASAYALGFADAPGGGVTPAQQARRDALQALLADARELAAGAKPWTPDRLRATMFDPDQTQLEGSMEPGVWPGPAFTAFPPTDDGGSSCLVVEGDDATAVWAAAVMRTNTWWTSAAGADDARQIVVAPLLPGAEGCPPA